jgi:thioredoxin 1
MNPEPTRAELDAWPDVTLLEFGAVWCPICQAARPLIDEVLVRAPGVRYVRVEDGKGKPLGRSFRVKLWPTLVVVRGGEELARVVRPSEPRDLESLLAALA